MTAPRSTAALLQYLGRVRRGGWWNGAACLGKFTAGEGEDMFFDYGHDKRKIREAKSICFACPVRRDCLRANIWAPLGIFGGLTERERVGVLTRSADLPTSRQAQKWLENAANRQAYHSGGRQIRAG